MTTDRQHLMPTAELAMQLQHSAKNATNSAQLMAGGSSFEAQGVAAAKVWSLIVWC